VTHRYADRPDGWQGATIARRRIAERKAVAHPPGAARNANHNELAVRAPVVRIADPAASILLDRLAPWQAPVIASSRSTRTPSRFSPPKEARP
jgi:hypothetical protein